MEEERRRKKTFCVRFSPSPPPFFYFFSFERDEGGGGGEKLSKEWMSEALSMKPSYSIPKKERKKGRKEETGFYEGTEDERRFGLV